MVPSISDHHAIRYAPVVDLAAYLFSIDNVPKLGLAIAVAYVPRFEPPVTVICFRVGLGIVVVTRYDRGPLYTHLALNIVPRYVVAIFIYQSGHPISIKSLILLCRTHLCPMFGINFPMLPVSSSSG
jgi:hypothetical protein